MKRPNFFIVGAPKSGTTAFYTYLKSHPNVFLSSLKEPNFFADDMPKRSISSSLPQYLKLFERADNNHIIVGEASVFYLYSSCAVENIKKFNPKAKILVLLRNQVDMVYAFHAEMVYNMIEDETSFERAWNLQKKRREGKQLPKTCINPTLLEYGKIGEVGRQLKILLSHFPQDQVKVVFFNDFIKNPRTIYLDILSFLELKDDNRIEFPRVNSNKVVTNKFLQKIFMNPPRDLKNFINLILGKNSAEVFPHIIKIIENFISSKKNRPQLDLGFRKYLCDYYKEDRILISELTGRKMNSLEK